MFVFFGISTKDHIVADYQYSCTACYETAVYFGIIRKRVFTLMFIPLIPLGSQKLLVCQRCGNKRKASDFPQDSQLTNPYGLDAATFKSNPPKQTY
jgi:hypothetical protein